ncbi:hypothetical protein SKAU_G00311340 [Synaphobranchus kaupii]|uniref:Uncharacterized protein n=1 Tax=Synaphobranchus kaupii TaxID=118154 RepID=A0A9Q1ERQ8_SYNKA|nr:hypothetical protein SKAU_G00311340 [Synaphobranchus kaupii]
MASAAAARTHERLTLGRRPVPPRPALTRQEGVGLPTAPADWAQWGTPESNRGRPGAPSVRAGDSGVGAPELALTRGRHRKTGPRRTSEARSLRRYANASWLIMISTSFRAAADSSAGPHCCQIEYGRNSARLTAREKPLEPLLPSRSYAA